MKKIVIGVIAPLVFLSACMPQGIRVPDAQSPQAIVVSSGSNTSEANVTASSGATTLAHIVAGKTEFSEEEKAQYSDIISEEFEVQNCDTQYNQLIKTFGNNYEACFATRKPVQECNAERKVGKVNVAIVFDDSGSMAAKIGNERMIDIAKSELNNYISTMDSSIAGSVFVYGHKGSNQSGGKDASCSTIESFGDFTQKDQILSKISSLEPVGWTPIDAALQEADKYLNSISQENDQKVILLISDGKETCGGNPVERAKAIASKPNTFIDVIGFNVSGDAQKELQNIAFAGGGKYTDVRSRVDFQNVFDDMKAFSQEISCGAGQAAIQLRAAADTLNTYHSCMYNLKEEQVKVMTHVTMSCESEVATKVEHRTQEISHKLESLKQDALSRLQNFEKSIQDVLKKF